LDPGGEHATDRFEIGPRHRQQDGEVRAVVPDKIGIPENLAPPLRPLTITGHLSR